MKEIQCDMTVRVVRRPPRRRKLTTRSVAIKAIGGAEKFGKFQTSAKFRYRCFDNWVSETNNVWNELLAFAKETVDVAKDM